MEITLTKPSIRMPVQIRIQFEDVSQEAREVLIAELYRSDQLTFRQAQEWLGYSWEQTAVMLEKHGCALYYDADDFDHDMRVAQEFFTTN